uniref:Uncharacterized protein n=1 Tax=Solanum tuberosum TaxID=4113 RepID=M1APB2_SOLTU
MVRLRVDMPGFVLLLMHDDRRKRRRIRPEETPEKRKGHPHSQLLIHNPQPQTHINSH